MNRQEMGERIRTWRVQRGWSQSELATQLEAQGYFPPPTQSAVSKIEKGKRPVTLEDAFHLADVFGVTIDELAGRAPLSHPMPRDEISAGLREAKRLIEKELVRHGGA